jgi:hypothetical protein
MGMEEQNSWWDKHEVTIATVGLVSGMPTVFEYSYSVAGEQYKGWDGFMDGRLVIRNDQFIIAYNPDKPEQHVFIGTKDVISTRTLEKRYFFSKATIERVGAYYNKDSTEIEYVLYYRYYREFKNGKVKYWHGSATFYNSSPVSELNSFIGRSYRVIYDKSNYSREVLLLNEPIAPEGVVDPMGNDRGAKKDNEVFFEAISL